MNEVSVRVVADALESDSHVARREGEAASVIISIVNVRSQSEKNNWKCIIILHEA